MTNSIFLNSAFFEMPDLLVTKAANGFTHIDIDPFKMALKQLYVDGYLKEIPEKSGRFF